MLWLDASGDPKNSSYIRVTTAGSGDMPIVAPIGDNNIARFVYSQDGLVGTYFCQKFSNGTCSDYWRLSQLNMETATPVAIQAGLTAMQQAGISLTNQVAVPRNNCKNA